MVKGVVAIFFFRALFFPLLPCSCVLSSFHFGVHFLRSLFAFTLCVHFVCSPCVFTLCVHFVCSPFAFTWCVYPLCSLCVFAFRVHFAGSLLCSLPFASTSFAFTLVFTSFVFTLRVGFLCFHLLAGRFWPFWGPPEFGVFGTFDPDFLVG